MFLFAVMNHCSYGSTLYLIANSDMKHYSESFLNNLKKALDKEKNYFSEVKILEEDPKDFKFLSDDFYVFLFGWRGEGSRSTIFFRTDGYFRSYRPKLGKYAVEKNPLDMLKNPVLVFFIPLDDKAVYKLIEEYYLEFIKLMKDYTQNAIAFDEIQKKLNDQDSAFLGEVKEKILNWLKTQKNKNIEKKIETEVVKKEEKKKKKIVR